MDKNELRELIRTTQDEKLLEVLWEFYELKYMQNTIIESPKERFYYKEPYYDIDKWSLTTAASNKTDNLISKDYLTSSSTSLEK